MSSIALQNRSRSEPTLGPLLQRVLDADSRGRQLVSSPSLPGVVRELADTAERLGYGALLGASPIGHNLVGAMTLASPSLRPWTPGQDTRVLVVDAIVAGISGLLIAGSRAHALGVRNVEALVVDAPANLDPGSSPDSPIQRLITLGLQHRLAA